MSLFLFITVRKHPFTDALCGTYGPSALPTKSSWCSFSTVTGLNYGSPGFFHYYGDGGSPGMSWGLRWWVTLDGLLRVARGSILAYTYLNLLNIFGIPYHKKNRTLIESLCWQTQNKLRF